MPDDKEVPYRVQKTMPMSNLLAAIAAERTEPLETFYLVSGNFTLMDPKQTPEQSGLEDGDLVRIYVGEEGELFSFICIPLSLIRPDRESTITERIRLRVMLQDDWVITVGFGAKRL